jgi:HPr kinase/phosphorylase
MASGATGGETLHASCVCHQGRGLLIFGPSGAGKSTLAMQMIALGAQLVADDRCTVFAEGGHLVAQAPDTIAGLIEARGMGILRLPYTDRTTIVAAVDLEAAPDTPPTRLPPPRSTRVAGIDIDFLHFQSSAHFPSLLMCYLIGMRSN